MQRGMRTWAAVCGWGASCWRMAAVTLAFALSVAGGAAHADTAQPVFRFFNIDTGTHFYTTSVSDRDTVLRLWPQFLYEGPKFYASITSQPNTVPVFRFYDTSTSTHFYTSSTSERDQVLATKPTFLYEGPVYYVPTSDGTDREPLYRFYNTRTNAYFYADGDVNRDIVLANWPWFQLQGIAYYIYTSANPAAVTKGTGVITTLSLLAGGTPDEVMLTATATPSNGYITRVDFLMDGAVVGTSTKSPYWMLYDIPSGGAHSFKAVGYDSVGASGASDVVSYSPGGTPSSKTSVTLSASAATVNVGDTVTLTANPTTTGGTITKVEFFANGASIGTATASPYVASYAASSAGTFVFTAVATDSGGGTATSAGATVTVKSTTTATPPVVTLSASTTSPTVGATVTLTAVPSSSSSTISKVDFYQAGSKVGTATAAPWQYAFVASTTGTLSFTAIATDAKGLTGTSAATVVTVSAVTSSTPKISLSASRTYLQVTGTLTLTASASSTGATVSKVAFYRDGSKIAELTATPYTYLDTLTSARTYAYTAVVTDSLGATATSTQLNVVGTTAPPIVATTLDNWRLLTQATFGPTPADLQALKSTTPTAWINAQFAKSVSGYPDSRYNHIQLGATADCTTTDPSGAAYPGSSPQAQCARDHLSLNMVQRDLFTNAATASDQLRQRVAWALSQILVTSAVESDLGYAYVMSRYQSIFFNNAFGNYKDILQQVSLSPAMGNYLDSVTNDRTDGKTRVPNENYAREIMQLFSIGLTELNDDGTELKDADGNPIPTYDQDDIKEMARVFTGYTYPLATGAAPTAKNYTRYYAAPMVMYPGTATTGHDTDVKNIINEVTLPAGQTAAQDLAGAVNAVFTHPNTPAFVSKQLIQRLVTGNPSPAYVQRVVNAFKNTSGVRGDMKGVIKAILLDSEARGSGTKDSSFGSLREPVLVITSLIRSLSGITDGASLGDRANALGQRPFYSPTVFNYFQPDTTMVGSTLVEPEFGIHNSYSAVGRANLVYTLVYSGVAQDANLTGAIGTKLNIEQFETFADVPSNLVDQVSTVLTGGSLPSAAKAAVTTAVTAIASSTDTTKTQWRTDRARMAVYLIASSYFYQVQH